MRFKTNRWFATFLASCVRYWKVLAWMENERTASKGYSGVVDDRIQVIDVPVVGCLNLHNYIQSSAAAFVVCAWLDTIDKGVG
jgi:hypothetical protein